MFPWLFTPYHAAGAGRPRPTAHQVARGGPDRGSMPSATAACTSNEGRRSAHPAGVITARPETSPASTPRIHHRRWTSPPTAVSRTTARGRSRSDRTGNSHPPNTATVSPSYSGDATACGDDRAGVLMAQRQRHPWQALDLAIDHVNIAVAEASALDAHEDLAVRGTRRGHVLDDERLAVAVKSRSFPGIPLHPRHSSKLRASGRHRSWRRLRWRINAGR